MIRRRILLAGCVCLALASCGGDRQAISRDDLPDVPTEPTVTVDLGDDGFDVAELEIHTDDLVRFTNTGTGEHGIRTDDFAIDTGTLLPGESTLVVFDDEGRYDVVDITDDDHTMTVLASSGSPRD